MEQQEPVGLGEGVQGNFQYKLQFSARPGERPGEGSMARHPGTSFRISFLSPREYGTLLVCWNSYPGDSDPFIGNCCL